MAGLGTERFSLWHITHGRDPKMRSYLSCGSTQNLTSAYFLRRIRYATKNAASGTPMINGSAMAKGVPGGSVAAIGHSIPVSPRTKQTTRHAFRR
jgi:hypothetical protein